MIPPGFSDPLWQKISSSGRKRLMIFIEAAVIAMPPKAPET